MHRIWSQSLRVHQFWAPGKRSRYADVLTMVRWYIGNTISEMVFVTNTQWGGTNVSLIHASARQR